MQLKLKIIGSLMLALTINSCGSGGGGGKSCDPVAQTGCDEGQSCEATTSGIPACFSPFFVQGSVFDLQSTEAIENARVVARDANGSVASTVAITDEMGNYEIQVAVTRDANGNPADDGITLRADAAGYQTFPGGIRQALPISTANPTEADDKLIVESSLTDIGLIELELGAGTATISGQVEIPDGSRGALVVAESSPEIGFTALADRNGDYKIFNLPANAYTVTAYAQDASHESKATTLDAGEDQEINLSLNETDIGTVNGTVQIVNAPGNSQTSIILVVESTFSEALIRGENPPGLRAPDPSMAPSVTGAYTIDGVPPGNYVVLAAFENDDLVRDPDLSISGTDILHISVSSGATTEVEGFKVTEALEIFSPGATTPETTSSAPVFSWADDSSEDQYKVEVLDSFGNLVWETTIDGVSGSDPEVTYDVDGTGAGLATPLESGMYYQFRATSFKDGSPLASTEDLRGVFIVE